MDKDGQNILDRLQAKRKLADARNYPEVRHRRAKLKKLLSLVIKHREAAMTALREDLGKSEFESLSTELLPLAGILRYLIRRLPGLARRHLTGVSWMNFPAIGYTVAEPYGMVLVVATWNYPLLLALEPLAGAYAAGNHVVLKLHDRAPHVKAFLQWIIQEAFGGDIVVVDSEIGFGELLKWRFDYVFYTGGNGGGREVLRSAAENFTPATLEMGGKSPCIVAPGAVLDVAARRIVWGKFTNCGQTCVAPDYLIVKKELKDRLMGHIRTAIADFYGTRPLDSPDLGHLVDARAYERASKLACEGRLICGGAKAPERLAIEPTVIDRLDADSPLLHEEIFGPMLPVLTYDDDKELLEMIRSRGKPLALYCFGGSGKLRARLRLRTSSGALVFDDVVTHFINSDMPFGGVGESGMGAYHGRRTFETFSHYKPVMRQSRWLDLPFRYPPFSKFRTRLLEFLLRW